MSRSKIESATFDVWLVACPLQILLGAAWFHRQTDFFLGEAKAQPRIYAVDS